MDLGSEIGSILKIGSEIKNWQYLFVAKTPEFTHFMGFYTEFKSLRLHLKNSEITLISLFLTLYPHFLAVIPLVLAAVMTMRELKQRIKNKMAKVQFPHILSRLVDYGGDTSKAWYIVFYVWNKDEARQVRKRVSMALNKHENKAQRLRRANTIMNEIDEALKDGGFVDNKPRVKKGEVQSDNINFERFTFVQALERVILFKKKSGLAENSLKTYEAMKNTLLAWLKKERKEHILFRGVDRDFLVRFFDYLITEKNFAGKTYNNYKGAFHSIFEYYTDRHSKEFPVNPCEKIKNRKVSSGKNAHYSAKELEVIKKAITDKGETQLLLFVQFIFYMFFRPREELRFLKIGDIKETQVYISPDLAKNDRGAYVSIPAAMEKLIKEHKLRDFPKDYYIFGSEGKPGLTPQGNDHFYDKFKRILKGTGIEGDTYIFKHTGNIMLYLSTKDIILVQQQNRHSTIEQTRKYLRDIGAFRSNTEMNKFKGI